MTWPGNNQICFNKLNYSVRVCSEQLYNVYAKYFLTCG